MAGNKSFLNKNGKKEIVPAVVRTAVRTGGALVTGYAQNQIQSRFSDKISPKASLGALIALGIAVEAFAANEHIQNVGVGMSTIAGYQLATGVLPEGMKSKVTLSGIEDETDTAGDPLYIPGYNAAANMAGMDDDRWPDDSMAGTGYSDVPDLPSMDATLTNGGGGGGAQRPITLNPGVSGTKMPLVA